LRSVIQRCLAKDPRDRFQTVDEIRVALARIRTPAPRASTWRNVAIGLAILALAVVLGAWAMLRSGVGAPSSARVAAGRSGQPAIAVMSFEVTGASDSDSAWLSKGVPRMLVTGLAQTRGLEVVSTRRLLETAKQIRAGDLDTLDRAQAADVARRAGAGAMVVGSIVRAGSELRIDAQLEDLASGRVLVAESARGTDVFSIVAELAREIRSGVGLQDATGVRNVADVSTSSLSAYRLFTQGVDAYDHVRTQDADRLLTEAVRVDPSFASAYLYLGLVSYLDGRTNDQATYFAKAGEHTDRLNERERLMLQGHLAHLSGNALESARVIDRLVAEFPDTEEAYVLAAWLYSPLSGLVYDPEKQMRILRRGTEVVPSSGMLHNLYGYALLGEGEIDRALAEVETYARLSPGEPNSYDSLGETNLAAMMPEKALEYYTRAHAIAPNFSSGGRALALAMLGRFDEAVAEQTQDYTVLDYLIRAVNLSKLGRYRDAEQTLASRRKDPEQDKYIVGHAGNYLVSSTLAIERRQFARARADATTARAIFGSLSSGESRAWVAFADLMTGIAWAREGSVTDARTLLEAFEHRYNPKVPFERQWHAALSGEIALAAGDLDAAASAFAESVPVKKYWAAMMPYAPSVLINSPLWTDGGARVARARGDWAGAIGIYRGLNAMSPSRKWASLFEPRYVLETARLLEKTGDKAGARAEYERFLDYWKQADSNLPELAEARRAVARLK
jgi:tetratricopeptide (TPR) repeat protein